MALRGPAPASPVALVRDQHLDLDRSAAPFGVVADVNRTRADGPAGVVFQRKAECVARPVIAIQLLLVGNDRARSGHGFAIQAEHGLDELISEAGSEFSAR